MDSKPVLLKYGSQPLVREFTGFWPKSIDKLGKFQRTFCFVRVCCKVFQVQNSRKYPRRPSWSFWYHLELRRPRFDRFRTTCSLLVVVFFVFLNPQIWQSTFFFFFKNRPWNHAQIQDLTIPHKSGKSRALYDQIWPTWCQNKVPTFTEGANQGYTFQKTRFSFWESPAGNKEFSTIFFSFFSSVIDQDIKLLFSVRWSRCIRVKQQDEWLAPKWLLVLGHILGRALVQWINKIKLATWI